MDYGALHAKREANEKAMSGGQFLKLEKGKNKVRILPPYKIIDESGQTILVQNSEDLQKGNGLPFIEGWFHYSLGSGKKDAILCPKNTYGVEHYCSICEGLEQMKSSPNFGDRIRYDDCKAKIRMFYNVLVYKRMQTPDGKLEFDTSQGEVQILGVGRKIHGQLLGIILNNEYGDITDPNTGFDITIEKSGKGTKEDTSYQTIPVRESTQINPEYIKQMKNLDDQIKPPTAEELEGYAQEFRVHQLPQQVVPAQPQIAATPQQIVGTPVVPPPIQAAPPPPVPGAIPLPPTPVAPPLPPQPPTARSPLAPPGHSAPAH